MEIRKYTTREIQTDLLAIVKDFDSFCQENNITYYLMGGSALGAMRHKGFIPWDDDIDVFMTYDNYQKFLRIFKNSEKYYLQAENTDKWPLFLSQIKKNNTTFISDDWENNNRMIDYFLLHHFISLSLERFPDEWKRILKVSNSIPHILLLSLFNEYNEENYKHIKSMSCFHKLSYKFTEEQLNSSGTYYKALMKD